MTIGDLIKYFRKQRGYSQLELAELTGLHHVTIRKYEANMRTPQADHVYKVADALDINRSALIGIDVSRFAMNSVGDLLGMIITLCQANVLLFSGNRGEDGVLDPETVRITLSPMLSSYGSARIEQSGNSLEMPIGNIAFTFNISPFIHTLLHWEKEYFQFRTLQNIVYNRPTPDLLDELEKCRNRKEVLELELQSRKDILLWPDGMIGNIM